MHSRKTQHWAPHYHRCHKCGGFFACNAENSRECEDVIENEQQNNCGLGLRELQYEARHGAIVNNMLAEAAMFAD